MYVFKTQEQGETYLYVFINCKHENVESNNITITSIPRGKFTGYKDISYICIYT